MKKRAPVTKPTTEKTAEQTETTPTPAPARPAQPLHPRAHAVAPQLFRRYNETGPNPNMSWDGKPVPAWEKVSDQVTAKWTGVADLVARSEDHAFMIGRRAGFMMIVQPLVVIGLMLLTIALSAAAAHYFR